MDEIFGPMQRAGHMILHLLQYPQIGIGPLNSRVVKNGPAPILHQVKERPCREHLAWRWKGNWNVAQATENVWKLQPWIFRWLWKGCACDQNYPKQTKHSAIRWLDGYTFTLNQFAGWAAVKCHGDSLFFNLVGPRAFGPETIWNSYVRSRLGNLQ